MPSNFIITQWFKLVCVIVNSLVDVAEWKFCRALWKGQPTTDTLNELILFTMAHFKIQFLNTLKMYVVVFCIHIFYLWKSTKNKNTWALHNITMMCKQYNYLIITVIEIYQLEAMTFGCCYIKVNWITLWIRSNIHTSKNRSLFFIYLLIVLFVNYGTTIII